MHQLTFVTDQALIVGREGWVWIPLYMLRQCFFKKIFLMVKGLQQTPFQGGHTEGPETYERMLSITSHQRDEN